MKLAQKEINETMDEVRTLSKKDPHNIKYFYQLNYLTLLLMRNTFSQKRQFRKADTMTKAMKTLFKENSKDLQPLINKLRKNHFKGDNLR